MEKLNIEEQICCPNCGKMRYWVKYFVNKDIMFCMDCGYYQDIK